MIAHALDRLLLMRDVMRDVGLGPLVLAAARRGLQHGGRVHCCCGAL